jgi:hypothetical protein
MDNGMYLRKKGNRKMLEKLLNMPSQKLAWIAVIGLIDLLRIILIHFLI